MRSLILLFCFTALALCAPSFPPHYTEWPQPIREYYTAVGRRIAEIRATHTADSPPYCNLSNANANLPSDSTTALPPPTEGLQVYHVAIGRGTQNYTCANATATPTNIGALATLYNASCLASTLPAILATLPAAALALPAPIPLTPLFPSNLLMSGHHFFTNTTPTFNLDTTRANYGVTFGKKVAASPAPQDATAGLYGAVPWLKLQAEGVGGGGVQEVYRVNTAGGAAPASCQGLASEFEIQYAAEYWFYK
ncbi:hypothetical protein MMC12_003130 [Toensbergia leucococca]|nr:hypothetical protein [Toensbergia leucococca]